MTSSRRVLADTSAWIEFFRKEGDDEIRDRLGGALTSGGVVLCDLVLLELWNGSPGSRQAHLIRTLESALDSVPIDNEVWSTARDLARLSREQGTTVPATDLLIYATAQAHDLVLLHRDGHFDLLAQLDGEHPRPRRGGVAGRGRK